MIEEFSRESFHAKLMEEQQDLPELYHTDKIVSETPSVVRETVKKVEITSAHLEKTFESLRERGLIPKGNPDECFRITVANGHEFQAIIYDPRTGEPVGFTAVSSTQEELLAALIMNKKGLKLPPTYTSQVVILGQKRNDAVATTALQFTYDYAAKHSKSDKILIKEWASVTGKDEYKDEQMYLNLIADQGTLYHQPLGDTYQGTITKQPGLPDTESFYVSDFMCTPAKVAIELGLSGYSLSQDTVSFGTLPVATRTTDESWQSNPIYPLPQILI